MLDVPGETLDLFIAVGALAADRRNDIAAIRAAIGKLMWRGFDALKAERSKAPVAAQPTDVRKLAATQGRQYGWGLV